jgi:hypothetical protein
MTAPRATRLLTLAVTLMVGGAGCSSGEPKDQFYGTDVGVNWIPLDAAPRDAPSDAGTSEAGADAGEAGATPVDGAPSADAPAGDTLSD